MNAPHNLVDDLRAHHGLCLEILELVQRESESLRGGKHARQFEFHQARKNVAARLNDSVDRIRGHRSRWVLLSPAERAALPDAPPLLRQNQDLIMKIIVLDRENEQMLLRQGLAPATQLPSANRQRPHYVAELYRRAGV
jgi:hypothetical protein